LVELLVVIAIIGILVALLLPAIQAAREAARRSQCKNNVKNIALGCLLHVDSHGFLPSGGWGRLWTGDPNRGYGANQPGSWIFNILPYVEEAQLHDLASGFVPRTSAYLAADVKLNQTPIPMFNCPSRRVSRPYLALWGSMSTEHSPHVSDAGIASGLAKSDYAANSGDSRLWSADATPDEWFSPSSYAAADAGTWTNTSKCSDNDRQAVRDGYQYCQTGVSYYRSELKLSQITDGTSYTYLVGEKSLSPDCYEGAISQSAPGFSFGENQSMYSGYEWDNHRVAFRQNVSKPGVEELQPRQDTPGVDFYGAFGSAHPGGLNISFCDGSVQTLSYDVDATAHRWLANRLDGQVAKKDGAL
jgi:prepilin-type processing-associated H-X9-DG protein